MSVVETTKEIMAAQLPQQQSSIQKQKEEYESILTKTNELILQLEQEKQTLKANSKKREKEEEEQWVRFQSQYDAALKQKQLCESALQDVDKVITTLEQEKEKLMELKTNKETEEEMAQWQVKYDDAMTKKNEAELKLKGEKERLSELRGKQSAYLKAREEDEDATWREFQERYDSALKERKECEADYLLKVKKAEEAVMLQGGDEETVEEEETKEEDAVSSKSLSPPLDESSPQSEEDKENDIGEGGGEDVALITDRSAIAPNDSDAAEMSSAGTQNSDKVEVDDNSFIGEVSTIISESQQNVNNDDGDDDNDELNETRLQEEASTQNQSNQMMTYDGNDDDTSLGATTISSRAAEYKKDLSALDKFLPPAEDENSFVSGRSSSRSISSRSIRRRNVIKPMDLDELSSTSTLPTAREGAVFVAKIDGTVEEKSSSLDDDKNVVQSNPQCDDEQFAMVVRDPKQKAPRPTNLEPEEGRAALYLGNDPPGESPNKRPYIDPNDDAINDSSSNSDTGGQGRRCRNVQWVDPKHVHEEDIDFGLLSIYERMAGRSASNEQSSANNLSKAQQQPVTDPPEDLPKNNYHPEGDDDSSSAKAKRTKASILRDNRRIRIATISSGYKTANYFVREDLDTRIYFHELEDAVNYMTRRGYARMKKEDEGEWHKLIGKAHGVVKIGPTKKKQRYRKGKLIMVLSKEINDNDDDNEYKRTHHDDSSNATEHTSLGRSVRCGFKSYSEKFLAEQEADKQSTLLQLTNGEGVDGAGHLLQLTNGDVLSAVDEATLESSKASASMGSDRKGVYGGGVRYFTSDNNDDESSDHHSDESEEDEESGENVYEEFDEDYSGEYQEEQEEMHEVEGSMGSMFSEEESFRDNRSTGVDSVSDSSTITSSYPTPSHRKGT
mmetsp:Transcript_6101/g.9492  ORF Transcript_6101/g.9492 Transcript_6101/m.9492 type:complete len:899 (+) Transcript_6101:192-2888(+)|eukprot:CAMPEP_0201735518 /NCGR_PEP_ID=MMETSP0593-20130828/37285_1 /ASSEMBLY_ACC=CAM_ASM_000672 /TAXON_ID=267983 /ORGANISM="Skeletonema japonicum, Strain CCMP2506" /LENGTH=898 /DNA_ID=CAMNT_0048229083 /DNA_START=108 /DNA_END=2804 /DNA_ORIENTATION=-